MLFLAIALFAALGYAFFQGSRTSTSMMTGEAAKAKETENKACADGVLAAIKRLELRGCSRYISLNSDGSSLAGGPMDGSCAVFNLNGGGVKECDNAVNTCMASLAIGQTCNGVIYAGVSGGNRIYTSASDDGISSWNKGNNPAQTAAPSAASTTNGLTNTNALLTSTDIDAPYRAAQKCRARGVKWYLPARDELTLLYTNRNSGLLIGTYNTDASSGGINSLYWTSTLSGANNAEHIVFATGAQSSTPRAQSTVRVRCIRRD